MTMASIASCSSNRIYKGFSSPFGKLPPYLSLIIAYELRHLLTKCRRNLLHPKEIQGHYTDQHSTGRHSPAGCSKTEDMVCFLEECPLYGDLGDQDKTKP